MKRFILILLVALVMTLTSCVEGEQTRCISSENFEFYEASVPNALGGSKTVFMLKTADGAIEVSNAVHADALEFEWEQICYHKGDLEYESAVVNTHKPELPEPIIEYVDREVEVEVPGPIEYIDREVEVSTHSIISENFIAEDGIFYYYLEENIVNLVYKQGVEIYILNILFEPHLITADKAMLNTVNYYNGLFIGSVTIDSDWDDAKIEMQDGTTMTFSDVTELVDFIILHYSFNEIAADFQAKQDGVVPPWIWSEENEEAS